MHCCKKFKNISSFLDIVYEWLRKFWNLGTAVLKEHVFANFIDLNLHEKSILLYLKKHITLLNNLLKVKNSIPADSTKKRKNLFFNKLNTSLESGNK